MTNGINTYVDQISNAAAQTESLMANAFKGMEDALVKFVQIGKLDFKSLADSIISDMIRIQIRQSIMKPLASSMEEEGGLLGVLGRAFGKALGGAGRSSRSSSFEDSSSWVGSGDMDFPSFAVGTPYVPYDMLAQVHAGERIVPAAQNSRGYGAAAPITLTFAPRIDSRTDQATIMMMMRQQSAVMMSELAQRFNRNGASSVAAALG